MADADKPVVFIDSNVLIEALIGLDRALALLDLAAADAIKLVTCELVVRDVEDGILERQEAEPAGIDAVIEAWPAILERTRLEIHADPPLDVVLVARRKYLPTMRHLPDIPVLAVAIEAKDESY